MEMTQLQHDYAIAVMYFSCSFRLAPFVRPDSHIETGVFCHSSEQRSERSSLTCSASLLILVLCYLSDRFRMRGPLSDAAAATCGSYWVHHPKPRPQHQLRGTFGVFLAVQIFCSVALTFSWVGKLA
jgi:dolichol kinase